MSEYALFKSWRLFKFPIRFSLHLYISCTLHRLMRLCTIWHLTYTWWIGWGSPKGKRSGLEHSTKECCQSFIRDFCYFMCTFWSRFDKYIYSKYWALTIMRACEVDHTDKEKKHLINSVKSSSEVLKSQCSVQTWHWFLLTLFPLGTYFRDIYYTSAQVDHLRVHVYSMCELRNKTEKVMVLIWKILQ